MQRILLILVTSILIVSCQKHRYQAHFHINHKETKKIVDSKTESEVSIESQIIEPEVEVVKHQIVEESSDENDKIKEEKELKGVRKIAKKKIDNLKDSYQEVQKIIASEEQTTEQNGVWGFVLGLVGLFILGLPLGIVALILGAVSLGKHGNNPGKYKGQGFAIAALILGIIDIVGALIAISMMT